MKSTSNLLKSVSLFFLAGVLPASAANFYFYKLSNPQIGSDFLPNNGSVLSGDIVSTMGGYLEYTSDGLTLQATGTLAGSPVAVVQDHENGWDADTGAGLGVYKVLSPLDTSDDNITSREKLTITFDQEVTIERIDLRAEGHNINGWFTGATFLLNGVQTTLPDGIGYLDVNMTGTEFTFAFDDSVDTAGALRGDQFYLAALTASPSTVPEGGASVALFGLGLAGLSLVRRGLRR